MQHTNGDIFTSLNSPNLKISYIKTLIGIKKWQLSLSAKKQSNESPLKQTTQSLMKELWLHSPSAYINQVQSKKNLTNRKPNKKKGNWAAWKKYMFQAFQTETRKIIIHTTQVGYGLPDAPTTPLHHSMHPPKLFNNSPNSLTTLLQPPLLMLESQHSLTPTGNGQMGQKQA